MSSSHPAHRASGALVGGPGAVARLCVRLVRRGGGLLVLALAVYCVLEVQVFEATYPDQASRDVVVRLGQDPAIRILQGVPAGTSIGAFVVWDAGWILQLIVGVWAVVATSRLVRGDEDAGRTELLLAGRVRARSALGAQLGVLFLVCGAVGLAVLVGLAAPGTAIRGAALFGAQVAGFGATMVAATAVVAQLVGSRGRVVGIAASGLGAAVLVRMIANSADSRSWVAWLTPLGWNDRLAPYGADNAEVLLVPLAATGVLVAVAAVLRGGRDAGASVVTRHGVARSRDVWLSSPLAFAWRSSIGVLLGWVAGLAAFGAAIGALLPSIVAFVEGDPGYAQVLAALGLDVASLELGYVAMMGGIVGVIIALYAVWRLGAARAEEDSQRLEHLLVRPVPRWRWLGGHVLLAAACAALLAGVTASAMWVGARGAGADLALADALAAMLNGLPAAAIFLGLAVALLGVAPRLVVPVGASTAMAAYVLQAVGPALDWPPVVVAISPFHHLALVPVDPFATTSSLVMVGIGAALAVVGVAAFQRRDLVGD